MEKKEKDTSGNWAYGVIGFFFPLIGLVLFFAWMNLKKKSAKAALIGSLIGIVIELPIIISKVWPILFN